MVRLYEAWNRLGLRCRADSVRYRPRGVHAGLRGGGLLLEGRPGHRITVLLVLGGLHSAVAGAGGAQLAGADRGVRSSRTLYGAPLPLRAGIPPVAAVPGTPLLLLLYAVLLLTERTEPFWPLFGPRSVSAARLPSLQPPLHCLPAVRLGDHTSTMIWRFTV